VDDIAPPPVPRSGTLRVYLGVARGVGTTFALLDEGRRRRARGADVVVGHVATRGRPGTVAMLDGLEQVGPRRIERDGRIVEEMDVDAVLARRPALVLVDELAHTNACGSRHRSRWQDVEELLAAGIDVVSTVTIEQLESFADVVEGITGTRPTDAVPDRVLRDADQVELVDMAPEALRRRVAHGTLYDADDLDAVLGNYFRVETLSTLRELALLWLADRVDDALAQRRRRSLEPERAETRERVVVALSGRPGVDALVRRAARIAARTRGDLVGVHVVGGSAGPSPAGPGEAIAPERRLLDELGGTYRQVTGSDVAAALVAVARSEHATQIVLGATSRPWWHRMLNGSVIGRVLRSAGPIDVHVTSAQTPGAPDRAGERRLPRVKAVLTPLSPRRQAWGWAIAAAGLPALGLLFANARDTFELSTVLLAYLVLAMVVALVGGVWPSAFAVLAGFLIASYWFTPPFRQAAIRSVENLVALVVFVVAAGMVAVLVDRVGRSRLQASRARAEAEALAVLAGSLAGSASLADLLDQVRAAFGFRAAALLTDRNGRWEVQVASGAEPPIEPDRADATRDLGGGVTLALAGGALSGEDQHVLDAFAAQVAVAAESHRLHVEAGKASELAAANDLRGALLQAVSHDLRTPLASIKASISSLRQRDVDWPADVAAEFEATIESETDRLANLVANLLDMSRLQASALTVDIRPTVVDEVVLAAVASLGTGGPHVGIDVPETLPDVSADAALLERAIANLVANAVRFSPSGVPPRVEAGLVAGSPPRVDIRVVDRGPGIPPEDRSLAFEPFQRLDDTRASGAGVGLGLAIARGFVRAMNGDLVVEDTPGGGTTMVVSLPLASPELAGGS
jgi:two-component system, OmpR family, sensor histidine kinase KdpD